MAITQSPKVASLYLTRGYAFRRTRDYTRALQDFAEANRLDKNLWGGYSFRAWIYATCPDAALRDGKKAISLGTQGCEIVACKVPFALECLSAACAEAGDFAAAVKWQKKAIELVTTDVSLKAKYLDRLAQFEKKQPYREQPGE